MLINRVEMISINGARPKSATKKVKKIAKVEELGKGKYIDMRCE